MPQSYLTLISRILTYILVGQILILVSHLGHLISNLSALLVGIIRKCFNGEHATQTSNYFQLVIPISKLLRSILDRTARLPNLISEDKWLSDFPISDYSVMKRQNMLRKVSKNMILVSFEPGAFRELEK